MPIPKGDRLLALINRPPYREYRIRDLIPDSEAKPVHYDLMYDDLKAELDRLVKAGYARRKDVNGVPFYYSVRI